MEIYGLYALLGLFCLLFFRNLLTFLFGLENYAQYKKRLQQLDLKSKDALSTEELIGKISSPVEKYVLPKLNPFNLEEVEKKLSFSGWKKYFSPISYVSFNITTKILAVFFFLLLASTGNLLIGLIWGVGMFFALGFFLDNAVLSRKEQIIADFPTFLRVTKSFLSTNMNMLSALTNTAKYVGPEWQELITSFSTDFKLLGTDAAIENLKTTTGMFEVREFAALLKLTLEKGGSIKEGFEAQAETIMELQRFIIEKKIQRRKSLGVLIQAPMILCIFATFALPLVGDMTAIGLF